MIKQCIKCYKKKDKKLFRKVHQHWITKDEIIHKSITITNTCLDCFNLSRREYIKKNPRKYTEVDIKSSKKYFKKSLENLSDSYIKGLLTRNSLLSAKDITNDLIKMKREQVKLFRFLKIGRCAAKSRA
jgi:hypothetical protein|tara:strand:+ start:850 stop:1236 length:387 start_codon:yes stop_codon:yes gene_type:complete